MKTYSNISVQFDLDFEEEVLSLVEDYGSAYSDKEDDVEFICEDSRVAEAVDRLRKQDGVTRADVVGVPADETLIEVLPFVVTEYVDETWVGLRFGTSHDILSKMSDRGVSTLKTQLRRSGKTFTVAVSMTA